MCHLTGAEHKKTEPHREGAPVGNGDERAALGVVGLEMTPRRT